MTIYDELVKGCTAGGGSIAVIRAQTCARLNDAPLSSGEIETKK